MGVSLITELSHLLRERLPFAAFAHPESQQVYLLDRCQESTLDPQRLPRAGYVLQPFDPEKAATLLTGRLRQWNWTPSAILPEPASLLVDAQERHRFHLAVEKAVDRCKAGQLEKVVLSRVLEAHFQVQTAEIFESVLNGYPGAYRFMVQSHAWGTWIGATPELLLMGSGLQFQTYSLAGTLKVGEGLERPVWGSKEREEQQKVTRYIQSRLHSADIQVQPGVTEWIQSGNLWHLLTRIGIQTTVQGGAWRLLTALHPTSAVGGMPRELALNFIQEHEVHHRELYAGYQGEVGLSQNDCVAMYVSLRCARIFEQSARIFVGAGITQDSSPESEFLETQEKAQAIGRLLR